MLTEEALIVVGALIAIGLLVLGTLELLWPSRPKRGVQRELPPPPAVAPPSVASPPPRRWRSQHPRHAAGAPSRYVKPPKPEDDSDATTIAAVTDDAGTVDDVAFLESQSAIETTAAETPGVGTRSIVDECFERYEAHGYAEVVEIATAALATDAPGERLTDLAEAAALGSLLALAQQALGNHGAARAALERAIDVAPEAERAAYRRQLVTLTLEVARALIGGATVRPATESDGRVRDLREALAWLEHARATAPDDAELREAAITAEMRLWPAYEQVAMALVQRQEFREARRVLREALDDPRVPATRAATFRELLSGTFSGEIGQLTAQAIRSMQDARESEALAALERAERLLESVREDALPATRREEVDRRLWWGYNKLGLRRVAAGAFEDAIDPLVRALRLAGTAPDRQLDSRTALVEAFEGWTEACALAIRDVADGGDREAAIVRCDRLWTRLRGALDNGLSEDDLSGAFARARRLFEEIGQAH